MRINKPKWIIVHHEGGDNGFDSVNMQHRNNPKVWLGEFSSLGFAIGYHYYIDDYYTDKFKKTIGLKVIQGRLEKDEGAHCKGMNTSSIGICIRGNYSKKGKYLSSDMKEALRGLLVDLMKRHNIPLKRIVPHRFFHKTECYGKNLSDNTARGLVSEKHIVAIPKQPKSKTEIKLLKDKIGLIEQMIQIYIKILALLKISKGR